MFTFDKVGYFRFWVLITFLYGSVCCGEICEDHIVSGHKQSAYGCPRLTDTDDQVFCCGKPNSTLYCCNMKNLSFYANQTIDAPESTWGSIVGKTLVCLYGLLVAIIAVVDAVSHFKIKKKAKREM